MSKEPPIRDPLVRFIVENPHLWQETVRLQEERYREQVEIGDRAFGEVARYLVDRHKDMFKGWPSTKRN